MPVLLVPMDYNAHASITSPNGL